ncbi:MAG: hypothetical protein D6780_04430 [Candidatus Dadabacteria bacterium]|nr:MAG: hypothetical protein D6780_04430 [Candidatus Dadabacteria bacterium]
MALKFRLRGLAETFIDDVMCPNCGIYGEDDVFFSTELTRVTLQGIVVVMQCRKCGEIFVPRSQRFGVINPTALREAVVKDSKETGEPVIENFHAVCSFAERLNSLNKRRV